MAKKVPPPTSLVGLIAWCKKRKSLRHRLIASYLETLRKMNEVSYLDTMVRAQRLAVQSSGASGGSDG